MHIKSFEESIAWQRAKALTVEIYTDFKECKDFSFRDQIQRAAVSIMNNIAEGWERQTDKEKKQFFFIAKGSAAEVRSMVDLAVALGYLSPEKSQKHYNNSAEIARILSGLIKSF